MRSLCRLHHTHVSFVICFLLNLIMYGAIEPMKHKLIMKFSYNKSQNVESLWIMGG